MVKFPKEVKDNLLHILLERNLLIAAVMKRMKTQIMQQIVPFSSPQTIEKTRKDIEKENIELEDIQKNTPLLNRYDTPQPRNHEKKTKNAHLNK